MVDTPSNAPHTYDDIESLQKQGGEAVERALAQIENVDHILTILTSLSERKDKTVAQSLIQVTLKRLLEITKKQENVNAVVPRIIEVLDTVFDHIPLPSDLEKKCESLETNSELQALGERFDHMNQTFGLIALYPDHVARAGLTSVQDKEALSGLLGDQILGAAFVAQVMKGDTLQWQKGVAQTRAISFLSLVLQDQKKALETHLGLERFLHLRMGDYLRLIAPLGLAVHAGTRAVVRGALKTSEAVPTITETLKSNALAWMLPAIQTRLLAIATVRDNTSLMQEFERLEQEKNSLSHKVLSWAWEHKEWVIPFTILEYLAGGEMLVGLWQRRQNRRIVDRFNRAARLQWMWRNRAQTNPRLSPSQQQTLRLAREAAIREIMNTYHLTEHEVSCMLDNQKLIERFVLGPLEKVHTERRGALFWPRPGKPLIFQEWRGGWSRFSEKVNVFRRLVGLLQRVNTGQLKYPPHFTVKNIIDLASHSAPIEEIVKPDYATVEIDYERGILRHSGGEIRPIQGAIDPLHNYLLPRQFPERMTNAQKALYERGLRDVDLFQTDLGKLRKVMFDLKITITNAATMDAQTLKKALETEINIKLGRR